MNQRFQQICSTVVSLFLLIALIHFPPLVKQTYAIDPSSGCEAAHPICRSSQLVGDPTLVEGYMSTGDCVRATICQTLAPAEPVGDLCCVVNPTYKPPDTRCDEVGEPCCSSFTCSNPNLTCVSNSHGRGIDPVGTCSLVNTSTPPPAPTCDASKGERLLCSTKTKYVDTTCVCFSREECGGLNEPACYSLNWTNAASQFCDGGLKAANRGGKYVCVDNSTVVNTAPFDLCAQVPEKDQAECRKCTEVTTTVNDHSEGETTPRDVIETKNIWTAIGCIPTSKEGILAAFLTAGLSIGGGVVLLMILAAAFQLTTSKGDPKATEEARGKITSAVGGLLFIIFSMALLNTIGIKILQIPGL